MAISAGWTLLVQTLDVTIVCMCLYIYDLLSNNRFPKGWEFKGVIYQQKKDFSVCRIAKILDFEG